ncbi:hypothetical protein NQ315_003059 [Exocentrus adspersus]|uniref:Choline transporter-like protein n=1 Tax=Exocentrus adspersus TaxID=1586481 RepID=A0AAV8W5P1_9CUCU|nr:hypothetical protein NQ315_003059 [Exocentrus adspersus]
MRSKPSQDFGEPLPYDPDFNGPLKRRSCTDVICLLLFLVFVACWVGIGAYAYINGDPATLLVPKDSSGSRCGVDSHVQDKKYLFFFDLTKCLDPTVPFVGCKTTQVCVSQCPTTAYFRGTINDTYTGNDEYCNMYADNPLSDCPSWYLKSTSFLNRCLYNVADRKKLKNIGLAGVKGDEISVMKELLNPLHMWISMGVQNGLSYFTEKENIHERCIPNLNDITDEVIQQIEKAGISTTIENIKTSISNIKVLAEAEEIGQNIVEDIMHCWWWILIGVVAVMFVCIIYIIMMRWITAPMVWLSIIGAVAALTFCVYFSTIRYIHYRDLYNAEVYEEVRSGLKTKRDLWLAGLVIVSVSLGVILLILIFIRSRIALTIALMKEGSRAISSVTAALFFPVVPWILQVAVIAYGISVALFLTSTGEPIYKTRYISSHCEELVGYKDNIDCDPDVFKEVLKNAPTDCRNITCKFIRMENDVFYPYLQAINVFGFFWLVFFASAFAQMVLASVFAQWYWTFHKRSLPFFALTEAVCRTIRYHLGTIAFGSLIIATCRIIRVLLEYIDHKLKKYDNDLVKAILCCCKCFFWCLEKFLKFINKNAYIMCAIHGKNFCASAKDAFLLLMRNILRVFVLNKVSDFVFFLSKLLLTVGVGAVAYLFFVTDITPVDNTALNYGEVPVVILMICTYLISTVFFNVYVEDCERNDGSAEKPYFMSKNLMRIFGKKNKRS